MKFKIYAPSYSPKMGGAIALHKLCDLLNKLGHTAVLYPLLPTFELSISNIPNIQEYLNTFKQASNIKYITNPNYETPVETPHIGDKAADDEIVVYPDITAGNPLQARNVVRWFLHFPGHHLHKISYEPGELHFIYGPHFQFSQLYGTTLSRHYVEITDIPFHLYHEDPTQEKTTTCYCIKKGNLRKDANLLIEYIESRPDVFSKSICIDELSHDEIAKVFQKSIEFYCFDPHTLYSLLAPMCGCKSITIPTKESYKLDFYPDANLGKFIFFGDDDPSAQMMDDNGRNFVIDKYAKSNINSIKYFENECSKHFNF